MCANRLIARGLLPKEIPPNFSTRDLATALATIVPGTIPPINKDLVAMPGRFSLGRSGGVRRELAIPNPVLHYHLAEEIQQNWDRIVRRIFRARLSVSTPIRAGAGTRGAGPRVPYRNLFEEQARVRRRGRYLLCADIAECYRTVYTHAIAWSVETRDVAKATPNDYSLLGNRLDRAVRNSQGKQTNGIPIGPDTSLILAELVLADVDHRLLSEVRPVSGFRFYDDYELVFASRTEAEHALAVLGMIAVEYGFNLNLAKTRILELPVPMQEDWVHKIRAFEFGRPEQRKYRIPEFFDLVFRAKAESPSSPAVAYAFSKLAKSEFEGRDWHLVQSLMHQAAAAEPSSIEQFLVAVEHQFRMGRIVDNNMLGDLINDMLSVHAPLGHTFEVVWTLWGAIRFGIPIDGAASRVLHKAWDSVTALLALHARSRKLIGLADFDDTPMQAALTADALRGKDWLLAYEAVVQGWLPRPSVDHIGADAVFAHLRQRKVRFYKRFHRAAVKDDELLADLFDWTDLGEEGDPPGY